MRRTTSAGSGCQGSERRPAGAPAPGLTLLGSLHNFFDVVVVDQHEEWRQATSRLLTTPTALAPARRPDLTLPLLCPFILRLTRLLDASKGLGMAEIEGTKRRVDFGILTIREDEFEAVLARFPTDETISIGHRDYNLSRVPASSSDEYVVAVSRCVEQGNGEAQAAARDLIDHLDPQWLLVVGIAGAIPDNEFSLGDVIVSTRIHDLTVHSASEGELPQFSITGGPIHPAVAAKVANLGAIKAKLGAWSQPDLIGCKRPPIVIRPDNLYGDDAWRRKVKHSLQNRTSGKRRDPIVKAGPIASSDELVKDTARPQQWTTVAKHILAFEMESGGVFRAARSHRTSEVPLLAIRGISDIVGFRRDSRWTAYACHSAAAFTLAFVRSRPIAPRVVGPPRP